MIDAATRDALWVLAWTSLILAVAGAGVLLIQLNVDRLVFWFLELRRRAAR